jgi:KaiC/GvpD/RAD55 family RecA-like ATPase
MSKNTEDMYDFADVLDVEASSSVAPGSSVLVSGPAMTGKEGLVFDILADGVREGEGAVVVTTGDRAGSVIDTIESRAPTVAGHQLGIIDCRGSNGSDTDGHSGAYVHHVGSPSDLTGMGVGITSSFERIQDAGIDEGRFALASLSTMLTYADEQTVFKFCHVLSERLDGAEFLGFFTIDSGAHDERTLQIITQAFDGLIEIREAEGTREARVKGLRPDPSEWVEL